MRNWDSAKDRAEATIDFAKYMKDPKNAKARQDCLDNPDEAKRQFATIGQFKSIPESVKFKVFDAKDPKRQDLVILVLPSKTGSDSDDATDIWIAAWEPWVSLE